CAALRVFSACGLGAQASSTRLAALLRAVPFQPEPLGLPLHPLIPLCVYSNVAHLASWCCIRGEHLNPEHTDQVGAAICNLHFSIFNLQSLPSLLNPPSKPSTSESPGLQTPGRPQTPRP